jgi:hypothetical protein
VRTKLQGSFFLAMLLALPSPVCFAGTPAPGRVDPFPIEHELLTTIHEPVGIDKNIAQLDAAALVILQSPDSMVYVVSYPGPCDFPGKPARAGMSVIGYLNEGRGINIMRIGDLIIGEQRSISQVEVWLAKEAPSVRRQAAAREFDTSKPSCFDAYFVTFNCETGPPPGWENQDARLGRFADLLRRNPTLRGYLVTYTWRPKRGYVDPCPRFSTAQLQAEVDYLTRQQGISSSRVIVRKGGQADAKMIELWLVPARMRIPRHKPATISDLWGRCSRNGSDIPPRRGDCWREGFGKRLGRRFRQPSGELRGL